MSTDADLVLTGARIWSPGVGAGTAGRPADGIAVRGDRIVAIGAADDVRALAGPRTRVVHAPGRVAVPGFQDAHVHTPFAGRNLLTGLAERPGRRGRPTSTRSPATPRAAPGRCRGSSAAAGRWSTSRAARPRKEDLDAVVPDRPVFLFNRDVHGAWVNSRRPGARRHHPATPPTPPTAGSSATRATGEPTGTLHEGAAYRFNDTWSRRPTRPSGRRRMLARQRAPARARHHRLAGRLGHPGHPGGLPGAGRGRAADRPGRRRRCGGTGTAGWSRSPTCSPSASGHGAAGRARGRRLPPDHGQDHDRRRAGELHRRAARALLRRLRRAHGQPRPRLRRARPAGRGRHRAGPARLPGAPARDRRPGGAERARRRRGGPRGRTARSDHRHHIAHLQVVQPDDVPRFAELGVVANCQAYWAQSEPQMDELTIPFLGPERAEQQYPFARPARGRAAGWPWAATGR